jgi:hypothetical protein
VDAISDYLKLWRAIQRAPHRGDNEADSFRWKWMPNGVFSSKTAHNMLFHGTIALPGATNVWHSFAPLKFKLHAWLGLRRRCWTVDRPQQRGLMSTHFYSCRHLLGLQVQRFVEQQQVSLKWITQGLSNSGRLEVKALPLKQPCNYDTESLLCPQHTQYTCQMYRCTSSAKR